MSASAVPQLRFDGFAADWEASSVGRVAKIGNGRDYKHLDVGDIPVYGTGGHMLSVNDALSYFHDAIGIGRKGTIDNPFILNAPFWTVDTLFYVTPNEATDIHFLHALFERVDWKAKDESTGVPSLSRGAIAGTDFYISGSLEQQAVGALFSQLDGLIGQHRRKYEQLQQIKVSLMQRMFPQADADAPALRFEGCEDPWKTVPLLEVIQSIIDFRGRTPKKLGMDWSKHGYLALSANNVKHGYIDFSRDPHYGDDALYAKWMAGRELHKGQVLFTTEAPMGNVARVPDSRKYILSQRVVAFEVVKDQLIEDFLAVVLGNPSTFTQLTALSSGGTAQGVSQRSLAHVRVALPTDLEEQQRIAAAFDHLDELLSCEQKYVDKLRQVKSCLLQDMFL